jgi:hypothetical protein
MPYISAFLPRIDDPDVDQSLLSITAVPDRRTQSRAVEAIVAHWQGATWPAGLRSLHLYRSTDGKRVAAYGQCTKEFTAADDADVLAFPRALADTDVRFGPYVPYGLHRAVGGSAAVGDVPRCFPLVVFDVGDRQKSTDWIDGLLGREEESAGPDRAYPGAVSANFCISADGRYVLIFSEWTTEEHAAHHMKTLIEALLNASPVTSSEPNTRYEHFLSLRREDR